MGSNTVPAIAELTRVQDLVRKLGAHLHEPSQIDFCRALAEKILFSVERVILMAGRPDWPEISDGRCEHYSHQPKKRKILPRWRGQVSANSLRAAEGLCEDGHSWRKYGQKDILNFMHPRAYYRCSRSKTQGCLALKQVQKSDENPSVFIVTYKGAHTCSNSSQTIIELKKCGSPRDTQKSLRTNIEPSAFQAEDETPLIFDDLFCPSPSLESCFLSSLSSPFLSPTTSDSNCFPWSPCQGDGSYMSSIPNLANVIVTETVATNSQVVDANFKTREIDANY